MSHILGTNRRVSLRKANERRSAGAIKTHELSRESSSPVDGSQFGEGGTEILSATARENRSVSLGPRNRCSQARSRARRPPVARALDSQLLTAVARGYLDHLQILAVPEHARRSGGGGRGRGEEVLAGSARLHARGIDARTLIAVSRGSDRRADVVTRVLALARRLHSARLVLAGRRGFGTARLRTFTSRPEIISRRRRRASISSSLIIPAFT